jgi:hypothetical protein
MLTFPAPNLGNIEQDLWGGPQSCPSAYRNFSSQGAGRSGFAWMPRQAPGGVRVPHGARDCREHGGSGRRTNQQQHALAWGWGKQIGGVRPCGQAHGRASEALSPQLLLYAGVAGWSLAAFFHFRGVRDQGLGMQICIIVWLISEGSPTLPASAQKTVFVHPTFKFVANPKLPREQCCIYLPPGPILTTVEFL